MEWISKIANINMIKGYSQYGEESIIKYIIGSIGSTNRYCVEFGAGDGYTMSNTRMLLDNGWTGLMMDGDNQGNDEVKQEHITADNINELFDKYNVPGKIDLMSIDLDGNDYWIWDKINREARVVVIEMNGCIEPGISKTIAYNPDHRWQNNDYYGASFDALKKLGNSKGYKLVYQHQALNMFFVQENLVPGYDDSVISYRKCQYHRRAAGGIWVNV